MKECPLCRGKGQIPKIQQTIFGSFARYSTCPKCHGRGKIPEKPCIVCQGKGIIEEKKDIEIRIPAGVDTGQILKFPGQGNAGPLGQPAGDLYVKIIVDPDPQWQRQGDDLFRVVEIPISKAILGGKLKLKNLEGKDLTITIPKGIQPGEIIKIRNQGIPHFRRFGRGNLLLQITIHIPSQLTKEQKELVEKLQDFGL